MGLIAVIPHRLRLSLPPKADAIEFFRRPWHGRQLRCRRAVMLARTLTQPAELRIKKPPPLTAVPRAGRRDGVCI